MPGMEGRDTVRRYDDASQRSTLGIHLKLAAAPVRPDPIHDKDPPLLKGSEDASEPQMGVGLGRLRPAPLRVKLSTRVA